MSQTKQEEKLEDQVDELDKVTTEEEQSDDKSESTKKSKKSKSTEEKVLAAIGLPANQKMSFFQFKAIHKKLWGGVDDGVGTPGHIQLMRLWNSFAILFPEKCDKVIVWEDPKGRPVMLHNDLNIPEILKDLETQES